MNNSCKDHLDKQRRGKAGSCRKSGSALWNWLTLKVEGNADRTAKVYKYWANKFEDFNKLLMARERISLCGAYSGCKVNTVSCILLNILASIYRFESFTWIPIQILYIHGHFKLRNMKLHVLPHTLSLGVLCADELNRKFSFVCGAGCPRTKPKKVPPLIQFSDKVHGTPFICLQKRLVND